MKSILSFFLLVILAFPLKAQQISGRILDLENQPVSGATVTSGKEQTNSGSDGGFSLPVKSRRSSVSVSAEGYETAVVFIGASDSTLQIRLQPKVHFTEEMVVQATRAGEQSPVSATTLSRQNIEKINTGMDMPFLLNQLPSVVVTSDAGNGIGYTGIRIRGSDPSRINVTINGIPINDAESQNMYWVDLPDLASSVENIQVQRGAGTSTNGAGAFGGAINIKTLNASTQPFAEISSSAGSFNTFKNSILFGTGRLNDKWSVDGRLSKITSDGYIDRASSDLKSLMLNAGYTGKKTIIRAQILTGKETTYQSWNGVPESRINNDLQGMQDYIDRNYLSASEAENLLNSGRTYNYYTYKNQVDDYQQDHYQLHFSHEVNSKFRFNTSLHYTYGRGYYEEYKNSAALYEYGIPDVIIGSDTITQSDLVRRKWLDNDFYGLTFSLDYEPLKGHQFILGGAANQYDGRHFHELTWMEYASNSFKDQRYYSDDAVKTDKNIFLRYTWNISNRLYIYTDHQYRMVNYSFNGVIDSNSDLLRQSEQLEFYNPKIGATYNLSRKFAVNAYAGIASKEPNRDDYTESSLKSRPDPEKMLDLEAAVNYRSEKTQAQVTFYNMLYKDQLVLTGAVNDVGNYTRTNAESSFRRGVELMLNIQPLASLQIGLTATFSENKIREFNEYITNYDNYSEIVIPYENTDIAFSPSVIAGNTINWNITQGLNLFVNSKYTGLQYLDNTESKTRKIDPYFTTDAGMSYTITPSFLKEITVSLITFNITDEKYVSNGYTYAYYSGGLVRENMYYPQAGINFAAKLNVKF